MLFSLFAVFASSFVIALSGALMPGPLLTATISESSRRGFVAGPLLIAGHAILELALVAALLLGLAPFFQLPAVFVASALAGAVILLVMAAGMFRSLPTLRLSFEGEQKKMNSPVLGGILMSVSNLTGSSGGRRSASGTLCTPDSSVSGRCLFLCRHIAADLAWYSFIAAAVAKGRHLLTDRLYRGLIGLCAVFLTGFAGYFAYAGLDKLSGLLS
jgi:threonine/homoserine/homoserine lactone efflux protein